VDERWAVPRRDVPLLTNSLVFVSQCSNQWLTPVSACTPLSPLSVAVGVSSAVLLVWSHCILHCVSVCVGSEGVAP
jgi:hypothetical protein